MKKLLFQLLFIAGSTVFVQAQRSDVELPPTRLTLEIEYTLSEATKQYLFGNLSGAKFLFEKCIEADEQCAVAFFMLSGLETIAGNINLARNFAIKADSLEKENRYYEENLANILLLAGDKKEALEIIRDLNKRNPAIELVIRIARLEEDLGKYGDAIKILREYNNPINEGISQELVKVLKKANKVEDAYLLLLRVNASFPDNIAVAGDLALMAAGLKKYAEADDIFRRYCFNNTVPEEFIFHAVRFYLFIGRKPMADSIYASSEEMIKSSEERKFRRASLGISDKYIVENYEIYLCQLIDKEINTLPKSLKWIKLKAEFLSGQGKELEAIGLLENSINTGQQTEELYGALLYILNSKGDSSLEKYAGEASKLYPDQLGFRILHGVGLMEIGKSNEMVTELEEVLSLGLEPNVKVQVLVFLGEGYRKLGRKDLSDAAFDSALAVDPLNDLLLNNFSYYLAERTEKLDKADRMSQQLMKLNDDNPTYLDTRGWVLYKCGKAKKARKILEKAIESGGDSNSVIVEHLGDVWYCLKRIRKAADCWERVASMEHHDFKMEQNIERNRKNETLLKNSKL